jgi:hypothetical protein
MRRSIVTVVVVGACAAGAAAAPGMTTAPQAPKKITSKGVGQVKLGKRFATLRAQGLVGKLRKGCELGGPQTRSARLLPPLQGTVDFTVTNPRRAADITIRGGAEARGVGIGDRIADIKAAFARRKIDRSQEDVFGLTFVFVPRKNDPRLMFAVDVDTKMITLIGVPVIALCE